jgi:hypothetical protein
MTCRFLGPFAGFFRGILENMVFCLWCFCGENVVKCVAKLDKKHRLNGVGNRDTFREHFFGLTN